MAVATASLTTLSPGAMWPLIKARIQAHYDAGADHVCILPLALTDRLPNMTTVEALAP